MYSLGIVPKGPKRENDFLAGCPGRKEAKQTPNWGGYMSSGYLKERKNAPDLMLSANLDPGIFNSEATGNSVVVRVAEKSAW
jgi:hypothetical protein